MNLLSRRIAPLQLLAERDFRNYFIVDAMFDFAAQLRQVAMGWAAIRAFITDLVGRERVMAANALTGPVIAGLLIVSLGIGSVFAAVALTFGICGLLILRVRSVPMRERSDGSFVTQLREGVLYVARTPPLPALLIVTLTQLPEAAVIPLLPSYAEDTLNVRALEAGFLFGSLATATVLDFPRKGFALILTVLVWDVSSIIFGFSRSYPLSLSMLFLMGVGGAVHVIFLLTLFQTIAHARMLGRVMSIYGVLTASFPLGLILGGRSHLPMEMSGQL